MSAASLERARRRCESAGFVPDLRVADAEHLPFADETFDVVYSYGVMHHSPDTAQCLQEAWRVLKPGGEARIMLYHHPSLTGAMLWLRYGALRGKSMRQTVYERLESPGTKTYTKAEICSADERIRKLCDAAGFQSRRPVAPSTFQPISIASVPVGMEIISAVSGEKNWSQLGIVLADLRRKSPRLARYLYAVIEFNSHHRSST